MWQLMMTNAAKEWIDVGDFETVTAAAGRIRERGGDCAMPELQGAN